MKKKVHAVETTLLQLISYFIQKISCFIEREDANYLCFTFTSPEFALTLSLLGFAHTFTRADRVCVMVPDGFRD